jgi:2-oxoglutarate dehydrogenase E2 component (dihydrolipoamide succinyltransferase)
MATEIRVPTLGESVNEATVGQWYKKVGDAVKADEPLVELETDKITLEVPAPTAGVIEAIEVANGTTVAVGALLGRIKGDGAATAPAGRPDQKTETTKPIAAGPEPVKPRDGAAMASPAAAKILAEKNVAPAAVQGTGRDGRITKADAMAAAPAAPAVAAAPATGAAPPRPAPPMSPPQPMPAQTATMGTAAAAPQPMTVRAPSPPADEAREERVKMTRLRQTIARRLKEAQNTAAMLTTFNEVDMTAVMAARNTYRDLFEKKHGVKLGFMGFFVKACVQALKDIPAVNAEIDGADLVYKNYYHIGVAVGTERGLVVPVVRDADRMSIADIEKTIAGLGKRARDGDLKIEEMQGGTFTISNGGIYGSLMSTPILNAPQSGILGMHKIQERPMVVGGEIKVRPMMYLALSYDHRVVDGREAVTFLVRVKENLEDPQRLVLDV